jgi:hypothetical protein
VPSKLTPPIVLGVNTAGNQNTSGTAANLSGTPNITVGIVTAASLDISGNADIDGTLEADAITVDGTALDEFIADTIGAMVGSNTETGITVTYDDSDNTLDFVIGTLNQDTTGTAALATEFTVTANNSTDTPAVGYDFFQGPIVAGAETDTAFAFGKRIPGYNNLGMTSFAKYINGDPVYTDPNDVSEVYYYMQGKMRDGSDYPIEATGGSPFVHPGTPSEDTGSSDDVLVDPDLHASGDRRFLMNTGPFNMAAGDSQEVVFAIMHAAAGEAKASVDYLKQVDLLAQLAYDIQFALPASPPNPVVSVTSLKDQVLLSWDNAAESYNQIDVIDKLPVPVAFDTTFQTIIVDVITTIIDTTIDGTDTTITTTVDTTYEYVQEVVSIDTTFEGEDTYFNFEGYNVYSTCA